MISLVIYGIIAIALAASAGYAFLTFTNTSRQTTQLQENQVRLETAASALRASLLALNGNGVLFPPMGQVITGSYTQLPAALGVVTTSPWGQPYLYCPIAQTSTNTLSQSTANVTSPDSTTYSVGLYSGANTQNLNYVVTTPSTGVITGSQIGYVGFIVSSLGPGQAVPACSKITVTAPTASNPYGGVSVPGGSVRAVTAGFPYTQRVIASTDRTEIYVTAGTTTGNATGQDTSNLTSLSAALSLWQALQPRSTDIYLEGGSTAFNYSGDLNAEDVRKYAQAENTSLLIATDPANTTQATLNLQTPLTLSTNTTFDNLVITHASSGSTVLTSYKPLTIRRSSYTITGATVGTFNIVNSDLRINDSTMTGVQITGTNSGIEFYNYTSAASSFTGTTITGSSLRVSFDSGVSGGSAYTLSDGSGSYNNLIPISLSTGSLNVSNNVIFAITASADPGVVLDNSRFNDYGTMTIGATDGGIYGSGAGGGIEVLNGSSLNVATGARATISSNGGTLDNGVFVRGSSIAVNGTMTTVNVANANIGAQEANITGTGSLVVANNSVACVQFLNQGTGGGVAFSTVPLYITPPSTGNYQGFASFASAKYGYPPMLAFTATNTILDTPTAALITSTNHNDPYVTVTSQPMSFPAGPYYVDSTTFEAGVRALVNSEFMTGISLDFTGTCSSVT